MGARQTISMGKNTPLAISLGFLITLLGATVIVTQRNSEVDEQIRTLRTEIITLRSSLAGDIDDVAKRQKKYVGIGGLYNSQIAELDDSIHELIKWIAATHGEVVP